MVKYAKFQIYKVWEENILKMTEELSGTSGVIACG